jgi:hypothetical protein
MSAMTRRATEVKAHPVQGAVLADPYSEKPMTRWRIAVKWGVALGAAVCIWTLCVHFLGWYTTDLRDGRRADQAAIVLPLVSLYLAISERARQIGRRTQPRRGVEHRGTHWHGLRADYSGIPLGLPSPNKPCMARPTPRVRAHKSRAVGCLSRSDAASCRAAPLQWN